MNKWLIITLIEGDIVQYASQKIICYITSKYVKVKKKKIDNIYIRVIKKCVLY